ncbi:hypothetical protein ACUTQ5_19235 [Serratia sp. NA_112.1]|uniref:hypothetical protein n=1 Tax=unclassified Serratia (in: enterobacteria) TaxID=2647522 RepID=UPI004046BC64
MRLKKPMVFLFIFLLSLLFLIIILTWGKNDRNQSFECRAKLSTLMASEVCQGNDMTSLLDVFLSFQENGKGYFIVLGRYSCPNEPPKLVDGMVDFIYKKEGKYYSLNLENRTKSLINLFKVLQYEKMKIKITELEKNNFILSLPLETPILCKHE